MVRDRATNISKGFGFVTFLSAQVRSGDEVLIVLRWIKIKTTQFNSGGTSCIIGEEAHAGRQGDSGVDGAAAGRRIGAAREAARR